MSLLYNTGREGQASTELEFWEGADGLVSLTWRTLTLIFTPGPRGLESVFDEAEERL